MTRVFSVRSLVQVIGLNVLLCLACDLQRPANEKVTRLSVVCDRRLSLTGQRVLHDYSAISSCSWDASSLVSSELAIKIRFKANSNTSSSLIIQ